MLSIVALIWGILAFLGFMIGLLPCVGWLNWINIPFALVGVLLGILALAKTPAGESKGMSIGGMVLSIVAAVVGLIRLMLGGGIF